MSGTRQRTLALALGVTCAALGSSSTASAACTARPLVLLHARGPSAGTPVKLPAFLRATLICGGEQGLRGLRGSAGRVGHAGVTGAIGATGATGATGARGPQGDPGTTGARGSAGSDGAPGQDGQTGQPGAAAPSGYAYVYDTAGGVVAVESDVLFSQAGSMTAGFTHVAGASMITIVNAGTYKVGFSVSADQASQITVFVNGAAATGGTYGSSDSLEQTTGKTIIVASAGDVLTIRNHTSIAAITLDNNAGGVLPAVDASVLIERLA